MPSNYKPIGEFIREVKGRNTDLGAKELLGINIDKFFMPSVANIVGTDLSKYKLVQENQFACNRMHVGRDGRIPVALSRRVAPFMVSPAYDVFEIKDPTELLPEYLMMWFSRREFDRNAWFYTDADVRGGLAWKAFCNMKLPVPSLKKQREIVAEYHTIQNRITLNNQLIKTLETTAQAIYKQWFVQFEFPNEAGQPYKSSGGELVESELGEIPKGWEVGQFADLAHFIMGQSPKGDSYNENGIGEPLINGPVEFGRYFPTKSKWTTKPTKFCEANDLIVCVRGSTVGRFVKSDGRYCLGRGVCSIKGKKSQRFIDQLYVASYNQLVGMTTGSTFPSWDRKALAHFRVVVPERNTLEKFELIANGFLSYSESLCRQNEPLEALRNLLLSKLATIDSPTPAPAANQPAQLTLAFA